MAYSPALFASLRPRAAVAAIALLLAGAAHALSPGKVEATAGAAFTTSTTDFSIAATDGNVTANTSRVDVNSFGTSVSPFFTDLGVSVVASTTSNFSVVGLVGLAPLTFNWEYSGTRSWNVDNAAFNVSLNAGLSGPGFIDNVGWGISYVDGPIALGDFAGVLTSPFGTASAGALGVSFDHVVPAGAWDGLGTRKASSTMFFAADGTEASFSLLAQFNFAGDVAANYRTRLASVTVADAAQLSPGAHLQLDNGSQIAITAAVPEPQLWAQLMAGLFAMAFLIRRRI